MAKDKQTKTKKVKPGLKSFSIYHKGKEYVIKATDATEARTLFNKLIKQNG